MTVFVKPEDGDSLRNDNVVVGYYKNYAIVRNEYNQYFYLYGKPNEVELGTVIENKYLKPIDDLMLMEQKEIKSMFERQKVTVYETIQQKDREEWVEKNKQMEQEMADRIKAQVNRLLMTRQQQQKHLPLEVSFTAIPKEM